MKAIKFIGVCFAIGVFVAVAAVRSTALFWIPGLGHDLETAMREIRDSLDDIRELFAA
jgi:hypothetical protein